MTFYFDNAGKILDHASKISNNSMRIDALEALDQEVVAAVSICSTFDGFPNDLKDRLHRTIIQFSAVTPMTHGIHGPDYESPHAHIRGLNQMISHLHDIFHELVSRKVHGFSDDPKFPLRLLESDAAEYRDAICESISKELKSVNE